MKKNEKKEAPIWIKLIGILHWSISGLITLFLAEIIYLTSPKNLLKNELGLTNLGSLLVLALALLMIGIQVFVWLELVKGKNWMRSLVIVFALLTIIFSITFIFTDTITILEGIESIIVKNHTLKCMACSGS